ncbi:hypothetical protein GCM10007913_21840 [Devosia yakushimensis]|uniref:Uncharacterized protein n=1 Tax=Devosia yakushimensis TaxID=470028 RepID=A0ABQ5UDV1_9HYPH|nr:hypothetical protein GCM10007913_21840 [Devosia yakushimensis]
MRYAIPTHDVTPAQAGAHPEIGPHATRFGRSIHTCTLRLLHDLEMGPGLRRGDTEFGEIFVVD